MIKLIALDFDGTTANTMPTLENIAVKLMVENYQLTEKDAREKYQQTTGLPFIQQMEMLFPNNPVNVKVVNQFEKEKIEGIFDLPLFSDAIETIAKLRDKGFIVAISSSTTQPIIEEYCKKYGLIVDEILGYREGFEKGKDHFNYLIEHFSVTKSEIIYVGDSLKDFERANGYGIQFIARVGMFSEAQFNKKANNTLTTIKELNELIHIVELINESTK